MPSTTRYRRGDIVLVPFPFTDLSSTKKRPALVVSPDRFNAHAQDVVLVAITSQPADSHVVALDEHDYVDGKLPRTSFVKVSKLFTTHPTLVLKEGLRHQAGTSGRCASGAAPILPVAGIYAYLPQQAPRH